MKFIDELLISHPFSSEYKFLHILRWWNKYTEFLVLVFLASFLIWNYYSLKYVGNNITVQKATGKEFNKKHSPT